jgi:hypothetical protein
MAKPKKPTRKAKRTATGKRAPAAASSPRRIDAARAAPFVKGRLAGDWYERFDLYEGAITLEGDLSLDGEDVDAIVVDGDFEVCGSIVNRRYDLGVALVVTGDLRADHVIAGGAEIVVLGTLAARGFVFGFYNHGSVMVGGPTRAKAIVIVTEYHSFDLRGVVDAIAVSGRGRITSADRFSSYAPALVPEVLAEGNPPGGYPDRDRMVEAVLAGRSVLRPGLV